MKLILSKNEMLIRDPSPEQAERYSNPPFECVEGVYCPVCGQGVLPVRDILPRIHALYMVMLDLRNEPEVEVLKSVMEVLNK